MYKGEVARKSILYSASSETPKTKGVGGKKVIGSEARKQVRVRFE